MNITKYSNGGWLECKYKKAPKEEEDEEKVHLSAWWGLLGGYTFMTSEDQTRCTASFSPRPTELKKERWMIDWCRDLLGFYEKKNFRNSILPQFFSCVTVRLSWKYVLLRNGKPPASIPSSSSIPRWSFSFSCSQHSFLRIAIASL